jgi:hypothetical protein
MEPELIVALTGLAGVLLGGVEMRLALSRLTAKVERIEERVGAVERHTDTQGATWRTQT